jgi:hypothetical protein
MFISYCVAVLVFVYTFKHKEHYKGLGNFPYGDRKKLSHHYAYIYVIIVNKFN